MLSEFLFYVQPAVVEQIAQKAQASLMPGGVILECHWRHPIEGCVLDGDDVHDALRHFIRLPNQCHVQEPDLQLDVWSSGPMMAQKEGISGDFCELKNTAHERTPATAAVVSR